MAKHLDGEALRRVYHHVFLPPKLPQQADDTSDDALVKVTLGALEKLADNENLALCNAIASIKHLNDINSLPGAVVSESQLVRILTTLPDGRSAPIHVGSQNAAVVVTRKQDDLIFETFELSPSSSEVLAAKGRLIRSFPAASVAIDTTTHRCSSLIPVIANTLSTMSKEAVPGMQPESHKAGGKHEEHRDTTHPAIVTELFMGFLNGFGTPVSVSAISKNTRDEVLWQNTLLPWRRSSMWLLIKVALHLVITRSPDGTEATFKSVMVFIMSDILNSATKLRLDSQDLHTMSAKIVRRLHKLRSAGISHDLDRSQLFAEVDVVLEKAADQVSADWQLVQQSNSQSLALDGLASMDIARDTHVMLPTLDGYIFSLRSRKSASTLASFTPPTGLHKNDPVLLPSLPARNHPGFHYATANLQQFELWIAQNLDRWISFKAENISDACYWLNRHMKQYHQLASSHYAGSPEGISVMILNLYELWVACDKLALKSYPMLAEYSPEISVAVLQNLLLPFPYQMDRLFKIETYLKRRSTESRSDLLGLQFSTSGDKGFAVRYFDESETHQQLKEAIEQEAQIRYNEKQAEHRMTMAKYEALDAAYESTDCQYETVIIDSWCNPPETEQRHLKNCAKCGYRSRRDRLKITVHEWPLPEDYNKAKAVVFELDVPRWYSAWRDSRLYLLKNVLKGKREFAKLRAKFQPDSNDPHLKSWCVSKTGADRVGLVSEDKPVVVTHYSTKKITEVDFDDVCVSNGLDYKYYDDESDQLAGTITFDDKVAKTCTYSLPTSALQRYVFRDAQIPDGVPPNSVIASQDKCPDNMSLDEYKELSSLPLGHHIQWANILQQLAMPGVDFKKIDTTLIILQCIYQTGPPGADYYRESHATLRSNNKAADLISHLDAAVDRIKQNWESAQALSLFASIATRVLSLKSTTQDACLPLLAKIRKVACGWMHLLREAAHETSDHDSREVFMSKSVEAALIAASTFDVGKKQIDGILSSDEDVSMLIQAAISIQQGGNFQLWQDQSIQLMRLRFVRFLRRYQKTISERHAGIDHAIKQSWSAYKPGAEGWAAISTEQDDWITTKTSGTNMQVHYNILSGELLVNGVPLDQPPEEYRAQPLYKVLFGNAIVEVMPATSTGFRFSTKRTHGDYAVQLGLHTGSNELIVQGEHLTGTIENVPGHMLSEDLPSHFVDEYVHWYNHKTGNVELRPIKDPWSKSSSATWTLHKLSSGAWRLLKDGNAVVGLRTATAKTIASVLMSLTISRRTHCILQQDHETLKIDIPAIRLGFHLMQGRSELKSKEFPAMAVDADQGLGTLVGLKNRLILKSKAGDRMMLLPEASVRYEQCDGHVSVRIVNVDEINQVHAIRIDEQLGRLVDSGDLGCKLFVAYLHALTSFCLPDSLTSLTGTEQALSILESCAVRSFSQLSQENLDALALIAALSPGRSYYPPGKNVMQSVKWDSALGFMAQHARLRLAVQAIFDQARDAEIFHTKVELKFPSLRQCEEHLQQRDSIRSSTFRVSGFGAEDHSLQHDKAYFPRDLNATSPRAVNAKVISHLMTREGTDIYYATLSFDALWHKLCAVSTIEGPEASLVSSKHCYAGCLTQEVNIRHVLAKLLAHFRKLSQSSTPQERYFVAVWLASMAFAKNADMELLQLFAMICKANGLVTDVAPAANTFNLEHGIERKRSTIDGIVASHCRVFEVCPEASTERWENEKRQDYNARREVYWRSAKSIKATRVVDELVSHWEQMIPPTLETPDASVYINVTTAMELVKRKFQAWFDNNLLHEYLRSVMRSFALLETGSVSLPAAVDLTATPRASFAAHLTVQDLFSVTAPQVTDAPHQPELPDHTLSADEKSFSQESPRLRTIVEALESSAGNSRYEQSYCAELKASLHALEAQRLSQASVEGLTVDALMAYRDACRNHVAEVYQQIVSSFSELPYSKSGRSTQHWPRISPILLLQQLAHDRSAFLPQTWKASIVAYGLALTALQRADRLVRLAERSQPADLLSEYRNSGHENWSPHDHPESLLMEIESGIMIRKVQEEIAAEMRNPSSSGTNAVMQLNMGEGKSTVIIPIVAASLADGSQLVRVVVAKPQSKQMAQMLLAKLGGLVKRRVYYMPFSRDLKFDNAAAAVMTRMLSECMRSGGILLVQPEHILSFGLVSPECYITGKEYVGRPLMMMQDFFDRYSRDIVDESDENFSVRFELIYTMGTQQNIELSPERWTFMQQVLAVVMKLVPEISNDLPSSIEVHSNGAGAFPRVRLLRPDATDVLIDGIASHIRDNGLEGFQMARQSQDMRDAVFEYISELEPSATSSQTVEGGEFWESCKAQILLLRGILAGGVLAFALSQKRWRVNYGLADRSPSTKLAVPYRAKDSPTPRSEFSHPDVVIILTSLCYYYDGLTDEDMFITLGHLVDTDQADAEYQVWAKAAPGLPVAFRQLQGINLKDRLQCILRLFPHLRKVKALVDFFLSHIVFPKEMKQFPHKLSVSGWDIGKKKRHVTTGFSGTNDSRRLLPLFVSQLDLSEQKHTNALVLEYLLQPVNSVELMTSTAAEAHLSDAEHLLSTVLKLDPPVQCILDVGAQILEYDNRGLAKEWLKLADPSKEAVVFVNEADELCVIDRKNRVDSLQTSPFASRLDACLVFLDESHTRGIDLQLPAEYRAAVTLGAQLTKDRLVQACMRMRKLGQGQTVVFCVSKEIQAKIQDNMKSYTKCLDIRVADVLLWSISETHAETRRSMPLWAVQGERFVRQAEIWKTMQNGHGETSLSKSHAERLLEEEAQSIEHRYRPFQVENSFSRLSIAADYDLMRIYHRCREFDGLTFNSSTLQEEQERELSPEIEQERQVQKAPAADPVRHSLHQDVVAFAVSGEIKKDSTAYMPAFESLLDTSAAKHIALQQLVGKRNLLVSADFATTVVKSGKNFLSDAFQRHVQWMITRRANIGRQVISREVDCIMIVSDYEANLLLPRMKTSPTTLHKYKARCNSGYKPLDKLDLFTVSANATPPSIPRALSAQLSLFAGQLYITTYDDYLEICQFLGLSARILSRNMEKQGWRVGNDGFIVKDSQGRIGGTSGLTKSPMNFFKVFMSRVRRNGDGISKTDMGRLLEGQAFHEADWQG
jgi:hypothetical protein